MFEINPLNVHGWRRVTFLPPHFEKVEFNRRADEKDISDWIFRTLRGRFYLGQILGKVSEERSISEIRYCAAFEEHPEASHFALCLQGLNQKIFP